MPDLTQESRLRPLLVKRSLSRRGGGILRVSLQINEARKTSGIRTTGRLESSKAYVSMSLGSDQEGWTVIACRILRDVKKDKETCGG